MTERDIVICGHGSGKPTTKNMYEYLESRYLQKASNGKHKGAVMVRRLKALTDEGRKQFHDNYKTILGRNLYSQTYRDYVYTPRSDGHYYSDCSSSGCATYRRSGVLISNLNTAGIYSSSAFETVPVVIESGHIKDPEMLKVGDAILFVGNDPDRPLQIGHVEFVYEMPESTYTPGWNKDFAGRWWYADTPNTFLKNCWKTINHHKYYFDADGFAVTGWRQIDGKWYFFENTKGDDLECALYVSDANGVQKPGVF